MEHAPTIDDQIAERLLVLRQSQGLSLAALAERSGVSKAMISRIERAQTSATAALLGRLAAGLGIPLVQLLAEQPGPAQRVRRLAEQPVWRDPALGYRRRQVSEPDAATGLQLVELQLPRGTEVRYPPWQGRAYRQRLWLLEGALRIDYGDERFELAEGDCLDFGVDRALCFRALGRTGCRYLLVISNE